ncbi:MAG: hypothetical protein Kow0040_01120 [Thermogutta sp.]
MRSSTLPLLLRLIAVLASLGFGSVRAEEVGLRISWGGETPVAWRGRIAVEGGSIRDWRPIGSEVDEAAALIWQDGGLVLDAPSPRFFDGVDIWVEGDDAATVRVSVEAGTGSGRPPLLLRLGDLTRQPVYQADLDGEGNRLYIERIPGDKLHVTLSRPHLVFDPEESIDLEVEPRGVAAPGTRLILRAELTRPSPERQASEGPHGVLPQIALPRFGGTGESTPTIQHEFSFSPGDKIPIRLSAPREEGVYEIILEAVSTARPRLSDAVMRPFAPPTVLAARRVQIVVLGRDQPVEESPVGTPAIIGEAVPAANPGIWDRLPLIAQHLRRLGVWNRGDALGSGRRSTREGPGGTMVELTSAGEEPAWEALSLPVAELGMPHVIEIELPPDVEQVLTVSILESNAAGAIHPPTLDCGVHAGSQGIGAPVRTDAIRHYVIFWPRTERPLLILATGRPDLPLVHGKIQVYAGWRRLPKLFPAEAFPTERWIAAYLHRPLFTAEFQGPDVPGPFQRQGVEDWRTFFLAGSRLTEYLNYGGYNCLVMSVAADGTALYPSRVLRPTPRFDSGCFAQDGYDPMRKDVPELLFRLFDREGLLFIPAMDFSVPLPDLESAIRRGGPEKRGLRWIGPDGRALHEVRPPYRGMAPYYNILQPEVQEGILAAVRELLERYRDHPSLAGLGIQVSTYGYVQLPGPEWGMDDATAARFEEETGLDLPETGDNRFALRAELLLGRYRSQWLRWRAQRMESFYTRVYQELAAVRPDGKLLLLAPTMFVGRDWEERLRPSLLDRPDPTQVGLETGLQPRNFYTQPNIVFLQPRRMVGFADFSVRSAEYEMAQLLQGLQGSSRSPVPGVLFYHPPQELRLTGFDAVSPIQPSYLSILTQPTEGGWEARRRFSLALAETDAQIICDGGWRIPQGQEPMLRTWFAAYRRLPNLPFQDLGPEEVGGTTQPVRVRKAKRGSELFFYFVNEAAFPVTVHAKLRFPAGTAFRELSGARPLAPPRQADDGTALWTLQLDPYDLLAVRASSPDVSFREVKVDWPEETTRAVESLVRELSERAATLSSPPAYSALENAEFESGPGDAAIPGWNASAPAGGEIRLDREFRHGGESSLYMASQGSEVGVISRPFPSPRTGRLTISLWVRTRDPRMQPPLRVVLAGEQRGESFVRFAEVGASPSGREVPAVEVDWSPIVIEVRDLPMTGLSPLQLQFALTGPGEVWIDDVQLCELAFTKPERLELFKLIAPVEAKFRNGEIADCIRMLEGFWPQYLVRNVPRSEIMIGRQSDPPPQPQVQSAPPKKQPEKTAGLLDRLRGMLPERLRF